MLSEYVNSIEVNILFSLPPLSLSLCCFHPHERKKYSKYNKNNSSRVLSWNSWRMASGKLFGPSNNIFTKCAHNFHVRNNKMNSFSAFSFLSAIFRVFVKVVRNRNEFSCSHWPFLAWLIQSHSRNAK